MIANIEEDQNGRRNAKRVSAINLHVGSRIRLMRQNAGMKSKDLAEALSVTYQQILAYENGQNKISAGNLYLVAAALNVPVSFFFDEMPDNLVVSDTEMRLCNIHEDNKLNIFSVYDIKIVETEIRSLTGIYYLIDKPEVRKGIIELMKIVGREF